MSKNQGFRDLEIYNLAVALTLDVYKIIDVLPGKEKYCIKDQLARAVNSVGANIAEGYGRFSDKDFVKFLYISRGSLMEVLHFLIISRKLDYIDEETLVEQDQKIRNLGVKINNLIKTIYNTTEKREAKSN